jgi:hypothetical protein
MYLFGHPFRYFLRRINGRKLSFAIVNLVPLKNCINKARHFSKTKNSMVKKYFSFIIALFVLIQCSNPTKDNARTSGQSNSIKDTLDKNNEIAIKSEITCPQCGHKKMETMPTDVCIIRYSCERCLAEMTPRAGDCCVFCTHGTHKCPSMQ